MHSYFSSMRIPSSRSLLPSVKALYVLTGSLVESSGHSKPPTTARDSVSPPGNGLELLGSLGARDSDRPPGQSLVSVLPGSSVGSSGRPKPPTAAGDSVSPPRRNLLWLKDDALGIL